MTRLLLLILIAAQAAAAQGVLTGRVFDAAGGEAWLDEPALVAALELPAQAPPFNEITAAQWQHAFTALSDGEEPDEPLGGALAPVIELGKFHSDAVQGDGAFRLDDLPHATRLAVAVKIGDWWWPLREELWFDEQAPAMDVQIPYYRLGADPAGVRIDRWEIGAAGSVREDLRFAPVTLSEEIRLTNPDPDRAAMVTVVLDILIPPGLTAANLPAMYGSQLLYMQGWNAAEPRRDPAARAGAWSFGGGGGMHGAPPTFGPGPQISADNWHMLNVDPTLAMVGAGDTLYRVNPSPGARSASLVFTRPVPPAQGAAPGVLTIRVLHKGGVLMLSPSDKLALRRVFDYPVREATAGISQGLTFSALVEDAHRRLYAPPDEAGNYGSNQEAEPDLAAGETAVLALGFTPEVQKMMQDIEGRAEGPPPAPQPAGKSMDVSVIFKVLALLFGLAFLGALVATMRKPRDEQLKRLAELPGSRQELLDAVVKLETDFKAGAIPPRAYQEQRRRLMNRLVEFDAGGTD
jgi:hypothetical protein